MTAGTFPRRPVKAHNEASRAWFEHSSGKRVNTDCVVVNAIRDEYPALHLSVVPRTSCDILAYVSAGYAGVAPVDSPEERLSWRFYLPPSSRLTGKGALAEEVKFGKYLLDWRNKEFVLFLVDERDGTTAFPRQVNQYLLSSSVEATNTLLIEAGQYGNVLHNEVWVFDQGLWQKSRELWDSVQKSHWEDVILEPEMKKMIRGDVLGFYDSRDTYERLRVPWKRGMIFYGPPGNGKTISIKAMMNSLYQREEPVPTLYVRTLSSFGGPEYSLGEVFSLARRTAPCLLVFEDLDSIVNDEVRSYFLNEVDGIKKNDGILIVGSTNHLDRLDPGIVKRPSRFDRKYLFPNPDIKERTAYMKYWQGKLASNKDVEFPDEICPAVARITQGFSFAYLQEAVVAALLAIARDEHTFDKATCSGLSNLQANPVSALSCDNHKANLPLASFHEITLDAEQLDDGGDLDVYVLWRQLKKQIRILREEMDDEIRIEN